MSYKLDLELLDGGGNGGLIAPRARPAPTHHRLWRRATLDARRAEMQQVRAERICNTT